MGGSPVVRFLSRTGSAMVLKLLCGGDDAVWMAPFLAREGRWGKCVVAQKYVAVVAVTCSIAVCLAMIVHVAAHSASPSKADTADKVVSCVAGFLLLAFSAHLAHEEGWFAWISDRCGAIRSPDGLSDGEKAEHLLNEGYGAADASQDGEEEEDALNCCEDALLLCLESGLAVDDGGPEADAARRRFIIVAALGNLDDLLVYFTIALTKIIPWYELVLGTAIGAVCISAALSTCLHHSKRATNCVTSIPCALILAVLAVWIIVSTFVPEVSPAAVDKNT